MIVRHTRHASTCEDPISARVEKVGPICRRIQPIPEGYVRRHRSDALVAVTKATASPIPSVKRCANASPGTAVNVVRLISKVRRIYEVKRLKYETSD